MLQGHVCAWLLNGVQAVLSFCKGRLLVACVHRLKEDIGLCAFQILLISVTRLFFCLLGDFHITSSFQHFAGVENYHIKPVFKVGTFWHLLMHICLKLHLQI